MLNRDFREFIQSFAREGVRFLVVGGYAVAAHGYPRYTKDLDLWVEATPANAARLLRALESLGFGSIGLSEKDFLEPSQVVQLGFPPNRVDLLTSVANLDFTVCHERGMAVDLDGLTVPFLDLESLKIAKRAAGRHQDLADLENLG